MVHAADITDVLHEANGVNVFFPALALKGLNEAAVNILMAIDAGGLFNQPSMSEEQTDATVRKHQTNSATTELVGLEPALEVRLDSGLVGRESVEVPVGLIVGSRVTEIGSKVAVRDAIVLEYCKAICLRRADVELK